MANETTSTTLTGLFSDIQQAALFTMQERGFMRPLVTNFNLVGQPGKQAKVGIYPSLATSALVSGEGTDATNNAITAIEKTFDTDEIAALVTLTDTARDSADDNTAASIGRVIGETMARKVDEDIAALFSGFSGTVGGSGSELTADLIFKAVATLRGNSVMGPYVGVFHPAQMYNLKKQLANAGSANVPSLSDVGNAALAEGFVGRIAGVDLYESAVVTGDSTGAFVGAIMTPMAIAYALKKDISLETQRDASLRATEIVGSMTYAVGELMGGSGTPEHGIQVITDAVTTN
jgi:N4-gp56 family major capsid protein